MKQVRLLFLLLFTFSVFGSCRNGKQVKECIEIAKKLSGQTVNASKKGTFVLQYGDDVVRHIEFVQIACPTCQGHMTDYRGNPCKECDGNGYVYEIHAK